MNGEDFFIGQFQKCGRIGDDAAVVDGWCLSQDAFFENVHFRRGWMSLYEIGRKAMLVNLSDAIAMNGRPRYALLTVAMPPTMGRGEMAELAAGLRETAEAYGVEIVGGDTIANSKLDLSVTIVAECPRPLRRTGIRRGDLLAYTGRLGESRHHLRRLLRGGRVASTSRFVTPRLRGAFIQKAARRLRAAMDISDGLFHDLQKLQRLNRTGFRFLKPVAREVGCSGEEYEMLVAFAPRQLRALRRIAAATRTPLTLFAKAARGSWQNPCRPHHF